MTYFQTAYDQSRLYRQHLRREDGLWKHIILGPDKIDPWSWATSESFHLRKSLGSTDTLTGNGWAAAGMLRVYATLQKASQDIRSHFQSQITELGSWALEIVQATSAHVVSVRVGFCPLPVTPWPLSRIRREWSGIISMNRTLKGNLVGLRFWRTQHSMWQ